jgi:succinate-semialdehyde dehydrogenase / glutarate-semialdehyde dehydrogenase
MAYATINPATGEQLATFPEHTAVEVEAALATAQKAFGNWRRLSYVQRAAIVNRAAEIMRERSDEFSKLITLKMGKVYQEAVGETQFSADILSYYAENAEAFLALEPLSQKDREAIVVSQPIGILFGIEPWNFPYYQLARFVAPNLMAGNTVIIKHAPSVPQCANLFEQLFLEAGAEPGVYTNLRHSNDQAAGVIADERVKGVAVTGSDRAGSAVASEAGRAMKRSTMELGGSDPFLILDDANFEKALEWALWSRLLNCGQRCVCAKRFIIAESLYDRFLASAQKALATTKIGNPMQRDTNLGPLASEKARNTLIDQVNRSVKAGATLVRGGKGVDGAGFFFEPAILTGIEKGNPAYSQEFFGPVFLIFKAKTEEEAIALANDTPFGLASTVFSEDKGRAARVATEIDAGMVFINHPAWTAPDLPFGGVKHSGYGRELSRLGIQEFVNKKLISTQDAASQAL